VLDNSIKSAYTPPQLETIKTSWIALTGVSLPIGSSNTPLFEQLEEQP
jgi:hypothetical protein